MKIFVLVSYLLFFPAILFANDTLHYAARQYTDENGLPQNSVKALAISNSGFLWLATENGMVRFDGQHFRSFNRNNLPLLSSRIAWLLPKLGSDGLFAITERDQLIHIEEGMASMRNEEALPPNFEIRPGEAGAGEYPALGLPNIYANVLTLGKYRIHTSNHNYFLITHDSIQSWENKQLQATFSFKAASFWHYFLFNERLYHLNGLDLSLIDKNKVVKVGQLQGDIRLKPGITNRKLQPKLYWNICTGQVLLTAGKSLYLVNELEGGKLTTQLLMEDFDFEQNRIINIYYDTKFKRIFMGSHTRGLFVFTRKPFYTLRSGRGDVDDVYYAQAPFSDDQIITPQGDVLSLQASPRVLPELSSRMRDDRSSILIDHQKNIWVKHRLFLYQFDPAGRKLLREFKFTTTVTMLYEDVYRHLYVGTHNGNTWLLDLNDPKAERKVVHPPIRGVCYFQEDGRDSMWIGTGDGLYLVKRKTGTVDSIKELTGRYVRSLYVRQPGELWITTNEDGVYLYKDGKLTKFPEDKGNFLASAHCMLEDERGFFWITTNKGLFQVARQDLLDYAAGRLSKPFYLYYDKYLGFNTNEFNGGCQPCGIRLGNGLMSFPSLNGLVLGDPSTLVPEVPEYPLYLDRVEIDGSPIPTSDTISLTRHFDFFRLFVSSPFFGNPYNRQLDFSLVKEGHAAAWIPVDADGSIKLSSLASGSYQIRIRKASGFGKDNYHIRVVTLVVPPEFYQTAWFKTLMALLVISGFFLYMRIKLRIVRKKNRQLEEKIDDRTKALQATLSELQLSEDSLRKQTKMQDRLITAITHDIKTPLRYLTDAARRLYENTGEHMGQTDTKRNAHLIYESGYRMYHLTDNLLQYIRLNSSNINITFDVLDLFDLVESKLRMFKEIAGEQGTSIQNNISLEQQICNNNHLLGIVVHNLIDNAVKATFGGAVSISAKETASAVSISVEDTGFGMPVELINWCNGERASREADGLNGIAGKTGLGLIIVKDLVALMHGSINVNRREEGGTVVELSFQKPRNQED